MNVCKGPECTRPIRARGYCKAHWKQQRRTGQTWPLGKRATLADRMADALDLLDAGEHPERVARRLGTTVAALEIQCRRSGNPRPELTRERDQRRRRRARVNTTATSDLSTEQASDWARMRATKTAPAGNRGLTTTDWIGVE